MPRVKIAALIEEMDAAGWILNEDELDKNCIPFYHCETGESIAFKTWNQVEAWLDGFLGGDRMPQGLGDAERESLQRVINALECVYTNSNVLPADKAQLALCLDTLIALVREADE